MTDSQADSRSIRINAEQRILSAADNVLRTSHSACFNEANLAEFFNGWHDLVHYYQECDETMISVEVVREYINGLNSFVGVRQDEKRSRQCHEQASEAIAELEWYMQEIIKAVERGLYPAGR